MQYGKSATGHPSSPSMPSPLTPVDGSSFYPTATDVDGKAMMLSPRFSDVKPVVLSAPGSDRAAVYSQFQLLQPPVPAPTAVQTTGAASLLPDDLDDIDALQCQWDMKHFEPGKLTESDLICLDTPAASAAAPVTTVPTSVFTPFSTAPLVIEPAADPPTSFPIFSSPVYHPYYHQQQPICGPEFSLDYSTPEVKELLCTGWLESDLLNVN